MVGNAIESSTCFDETSNSDISNVSKEDRDRFKALGLIIAFCLVKRGIVVEFIAFERASVAGECDWELDIMLFIVRVG